MRQNEARDDFDFDEDAIRKIAYAVWERRGAPIGSPDVDWIEAERQLREERLDLRADGQRPERTQRKSAPTRLKTQDSKDKTYAG
jgi:hypothetical protein